MTTAPGDEAAFEGFDADADKDEDEDADEDADERGASGWRAGDLSSSYWPAFTSTSKSTKSDAIDIEDLLPLASELPTPRGDFDEEVGRIGSAGCLAPEAALAAAPAAGLLLASGNAGAEAAVDAEDEAEEDDEEEEDDEDDDEDAEMAASFRESGSGEATAFLSDGSRLISEF